MSRKTQLYEPAQRLHVAAREKDFVKPPREENHALCRFPGPINSLFLWTSMSSSICCRHARLWGQRVSAVEYSAAQDCFSLMRAAKWKRKSFLTAGKTWLVINFMSSG